MAFITDLLENKKGWIYLLGLVVLFILREEDCALDDRCCLPPVFLDKEPEIDMPYS